MPNLGSEIPASEKLPDGWRRIRIGDALRAVSRPVKMRDPELYRLVSVRRGYGGMFDREVLRGRDILTKGLEWVCPGSFILARMQIVHGACCLVPSDMAGAAVSKSYCQFQGTRNCDIRFFSWLAQSPRLAELFLDASQGVVIEKMTFDLDRWKSFTVDLPPVSDQRQIVRILDGVEETLRVTEKLIAKLKQLKQGLLDDILTRGIDDNGVVRDPQSHPDQFRTTPRGLMPAGWTTAMVGELFEIQLGKMLSAPASRGPNQRPYLGNKAVQWDRVNIDDLPTMSFSRSESDKFRLRPRDLLVCEGGEVGRSAIWRGEIAECYYQKAIHRLRPLKGYLPELMVRVMRLGASSGWFANFTSQTSIAHLTQEKLAVLPIPVPPEPEQSRIVAVLDSIDQRIEVEERLRDQILFLKKGLMGDLLTGRVCVTPMLESANA